MNILEDTMIKKYWIRYLSDLQIYNYKSGKSSDEEKYIVEKLREFPANKARFEEYVVQPIEKESLTKGINRLKELAKETQKIVLNKKEKNIKPRAGQIWKLKRVPEIPSSEEIIPIAQDVFVFLMSKPFPYVSDIVDEEISEDIKEAHLLNAVLISFDTHFAVENDVIYNDNNDYLGVSFMIQTELEFSVIRANLDFFVCELNQDDKNTVLEVYLKANALNYKEEIVNSACLGKSIESKEDYEYLYKMIQADNTNILAEPVNFLDEILTPGRDITELIGESFQVYETQESAEISRISEPTESNENKIKLFESSTCTLSIKRDEDNRIWFNIICDESTNIDLEIVDILNRSIWKSGNKQIKMNKAKNILLTKPIYDKLVYIKLFINGNLEVKINVKF